MITTHEWGANQSKDATRDSHPIGLNPGITLHWTGDGYGWPWSHSRCFDLVRGIERHHEYGNGWGDIAYNLLGCPHGDIFEGRGFGVRSSANGNQERNRARYAVCYLGGAGDEFTPAGQRAMRAAVQLLHKKGGARLDVNGHRDGWPTTCPGPVIYRWIAATDWNNPQEEDMPYTDWPQRDRDALAADVAAALGRVPVPSDDDRTVDVSTALGWAWHHARAAHFASRRGIDVQKLATKVAERVGPAADAHAIAEELLRQITEDDPA